MPSTSVIARGVALAVIVAIVALGSLASGRAPAPSEGRFAVWVERASQSVKAKMRSYFCVPPQGDLSGYCVDGQPGPTHFRRRLPVGACQDVKVRAGYPARLVKLRVEAEKGRALTRTKRARPVAGSEQLFRATLRRLPPASDHLQIKVVHVDGNRGTYEGGIERLRTRC